MKPPLMHQSSGVCPALSTMDQRAPEEEQDEAREWPAPPRPWLAAGSGQQAAGTEICATPPHVRKSKGAPTTWAGGSTVVEKPVGSLLVPAAAGQVDGRVPAPGTIAIDGSQK